MSLRALSGRGRAGQYAGGATFIPRFGLTARYRMAKELVFARCALAALAGLPEVNCRRRGRVGECLIQNQL